MANKKKSPPSAGLRQREEWNVPDWKKPGGYPVWDSLNLDQKKWEFLRRIPQYRKDWKAYIQTPSKFTLKDRRFPCSQYGITQVVPPQFSHTDLPDGFHFLEPALVGGELIYPRPKIYEQLRHNRSVGKTLSFEENIDLHYEDEFLSSLAPPIEWYHGSVWIEFNFTENLKAQIQKAEKAIQQAKREAEMYMRSYKDQDTGNNLFKDSIQAIDKSSRSPRGANKELKNTMHPDEILLRVLDGVNCGQTQDQVSVYLGDLIDNQIDPRTIGRQYQRALTHWKRLT